MKSNLSLNINIEMNCDSIVITDIFHNVVCVISNNEVIIKNGYHIYRCKDEPTFSKQNNECYKYNPILGN